MRIRRKLSAFAADRLALRKLVEAKEEEIQELQENCAHLQTELDAATVRLEAFEESDLPVLPFVRALSFLCPTEMKLSLVCQDLC